MSPPIKCSPSAAHRWAECTAAQAFIIENELDAYTTKTYTEEGKIAAEWAENWVKSKETLSVPDEDVRVVLGLTEPVTTDLRPMKREYLPLISKLTARALRWGAEIEVTPWYAGSGRGFIDFAAYGANGVLYVLDLKYGRGKVVDVKYNRQLLIYAESLKRLWCVPPRTPVELGVCQPRAGCYGTTWWSPDEDDIIEVNAALRRGYILNQHPELRTFRPSASACAFCPAMGDVAKQKGIMCPAFTALGDEMTQTFSVLPNVADLSLAVHAGAVSDATLRFAAANRCTIAALVDVAKDLVYTDLQARGDASQYADQFRLGVGRRGNKRWQDGADLSEFMQPPSAPKPMSPTQVALKVKEGELTGDLAERAEALLKSHTFQAPGGPVLKLATDPGPAWVGSKLIDAADL